MLLCLLACTAALQTDILKLEDPSGDSDSAAAYSVSVTPDGLHAVVPHAYGGTTLVGLGPGATTSTLSAQGGGSDSVVTPNGSTVLVLDSWFDTVWFMDISSMSVVAGVPIPVSSWSGLDLDSTGTRAAASSSCASTYVVAVLNVATQTLEHSFTPAGAFAGCDFSFRFAADDVTLVSARLHAIVGYDSTTGVLVGQTTFATNGSIARACLFRADRRVAYVLTQRGALSPNPRIWLETFDLPSLTRTSVVPLARGLLVASGREVASLDDAGARLLFTTSTTVYVVDLSSGAVTELASTTILPGNLALSRDGTRAYVSDENGARIFNAITGVAMGDIPQGSRLSVPAFRGPEGQRFLLADRERLRLIDASQSPIRVVEDLSTGAGLEMDGPFAFELMGDGRRTVVTARDSDDLRVIDLDDRALLQRVGLARGPVDVALLDTGDLVVVHRESERCSIIDTTTWTVRSEISLPAPATQVEAVPGTTLAWVHVDGPQIRALLLIETIASGSVVGGFQLPGHANLPDSIESVLFDLVRQRAFVLDAAAGDITLVDLAAQAVVHSAFFRPGSIARMSLSPGGDQVTVVSSSSEVTSFHVGPTRLTAAWMHACIPVHPNWADPLAPLVALDGGRILHVSLGQSPVGTCPGPILIRVSDGALISWNGGLSGPTDHTFVSGAEAVDHDQGSMVRQRRFLGDGLRDTTSSPQSLWWFTHRPMRDPESLVTFVPGLSSSPWPPGQVLAFLDFVTPNASQACAPTVPNSIGNDATLSFAGGGLAGEPLVVTVSGLRPNSMPSMLLVADAVAAPVLVPGGIGSICLGGRIGRFVHQVQLADASGRASVRVETSALPLATGSTAALPGDSWTFQSWYRDTNSVGTPASHFSEAVTLILQ